MRTRIACSLMVGLFSLFASAQTPTVLMNYGQAGKFVGDVTGDGIPDFENLPPVTGGAPYQSGFDGSPIGSLPDFGHPGQIQRTTVGDLDGDGANDILFSWVETIIPAQGGFPAYLRVTYWGYSLADAAQIFTFAVGSGAAGWSGPDVRTTPAIFDVGDVNGDGKDDFALTTTGFAVQVTGEGGSVYVSIPGFCNVYSAANLTTTESFTINPQIFNFGNSAWNVSCTLGRLGDVNGDGFADYSRRLLRFAGAETSLRLGPSGASYFQVTSNGIIVAGVGDVDGDGKDDIAYHNAFATAESFYVGILRGYDLEPLYIFQQIPGQYVGFNFRGGLGDINHDGHADFGVFANRPANTVPSGVQVRSGLDGAIIYTPPTGSTVGRAGDLNLDGYDDIFVGTNIVSFRPNHTPPSAVTIGAACAGSTAVLTVGPPALGGSVVVELSGLPSPGDAVLLASFPPAQPLIVDGGPDFLTPCSLYVDLGAVLVFPIDVSLGSFSLIATVPQIPTAEGLMLNLQAAIWPASGGFYTSNAVQVVYGY